MVDHRNLKLRASLGLVVLLVHVMLVIGAGSHASGLQNNRSRAKAVDELYEKHCVKCHGPDGRGETAMGEVFNAPDFTDRDRWAKSTTQSLRQTVTRGKSGMPAFGKKLTRAQINSLVDRVRKFGN